MVLVHNDTVGDMNLEVFYTEDHKFKVVVKLISDPTKFREELIQSNYEPRFGIDISDMDNILVTAEKLAIELESS